MYPIIIAFAALAAIVISMIVYEQRRLSAIERELASRGFAVRLKPDLAEREQAFLPLLSLDNLKTGSSGVKWLARGRVGRHDAIVVEHAFSTGTGKSKRTVRNTLVAAPGSGDWPMLTLTGESVFHRLGEKLGAAADVKLEDERFNRKWRVRCPDEGFAMAVLTPEVQHLLGDAARAEWWSIGGPDGIVCLGRCGAVNARAAGEMLERLEAFLAALAPQARDGLGLSREGDSRS
ncbi:MAG: hypothetical protein ACK4WH_08140 [Phycisphaerales bacterium]